jgi:uncharacterized protein YndB with AHSA1/START domain
MTPAVIHKSFTIERSYSSSPARVFNAHADPSQKRRWFAEGKGFVVISYSLDFVVGGVERCRFRHGDGPLMTFDAVFLDIVPDERIVFAYGMTQGGAAMSASLSTTELLVATSGTLLRFTEHTAFLDGKDASVGRRQGSVGMLEALAKDLELL